MTPYLRMHEQFPRLARDRSIPLARQRRDRRMDSPEYDAPVRMCADDPSNTVRQPSTRGLHEKSSSSSSARRNLTSVQRSLPAGRRKVSEWARAQNAAGHRLEPRILEPDAPYPAAGSGGKDPAGSGAWPLTAFLFLQAEDLAEAATIAASHPAVRFGAMLEVRSWAPPVVLARASGGR